MAFEIVSRPVKEHQCDLPGWWGKTLYGIERGTVIRCKRCKEEWIYERDKYSLDLKWKKVEPPTPPRKHCCQCTVLQKKNCPEHGESDKIKPDLSAEEVQEMLEIECEHYLNMTLDELKYAVTMGSPPNHPAVAHIRILGGF